MNFPNQCISCTILQALRLTMVQILINSKGLNMNPLQSLYYVSPACMVSLLLPFCEYYMWTGALDLD